MPPARSEATVDRAADGWRVVTVEGASSSVTFYVTREAAIESARAWVNAHGPGRVVVRGARGDQVEEIPAREQGSLGAIAG